MSAWARGYQQAGEGSIQLSSTQLAIDLMKYYSGFAKSFISDKVFLSHPTIKIKYGIPVLQKTMILGLFGADLKGFLGCYLVIKKNNFIDNQCVV